MFSKKERDLIARNMFDWSRENRELVRRCERAERLMIQLAKEIPVIKRKQELIRAINARQLAKLQQQEQELIKLRSIVKLPIVIK